MSLIGLVMNLLLAGLLLAALMMGFRLNRRLKVLRDSHAGFEAAVKDLNLAAARAEQGLADLRAATDEAVDLLADRIEKGRTLATRLERQTDKLERLAEHAPPLRAAAREAGGLDAVTERRLGALLAAAREARPEPRPAAQAQPRPGERPMPPRRPSLDDELFDDEPLTLNDVRGVRR
jgi:hypothetical protein